MGICEGKRKLKEPGKIWTEKENIGMKNTVPNLASE
jgi:hypothetical protein